MKVLEPLPHGAIADLERAIALLEFWELNKSCTVKARAALKAVRAQNAAVKEAARLSAEAIEQSGETPH